MLENCDKVFDVVPKNIKSKVQFVVNMSSCYFPDNKRIFKFYDDCEEWDYKSKNYKLCFYQKSDFTRVYCKKGVFFRKSKIGSVENCIKLPEQLKPCDLVQNETFS